MPGRSARDLALQDDRARHDDPQVLVLGLSTLPDQGAVYDGREPAHHALGARGGTRSDAGTAREDAGRCAHPQANRGARLWHPQELDGCDALPDEATTQRTNRDEPARPGLQHETRDADLRSCASDEGDQGVKHPLFCRNNRNDRSFMPVQSRSITPTLKRISVFTYMDPPPFARRCFGDFALIEIAAIYPACC